MLRNERLLGQVRRGLVPVLVATALAPLLAFAQTAQQLQMLGELPAAERQKLLQQLGGADSATGRPLQEAPDLLLPAASDATTDNATAKSDSSATDVLRPFGYELFRAQPTTFAPVTDVPVPADYVLGPGDTLQLYLYGKESGEYTLTVDRTGQVYLPDIGPLAVAGMRYSEAKDAIRGRISEARIGVNATVTMGELRSIRVFVAGDARNPGSYTVSGLATMTQALYVSGGVKEIGSLRNVQLRRAGQTIATLDLYDLLLRGDSSDDARLQPGDVVFIPPVQTTVSVSGAVRRPAIYELRGERKVSDILPLAGGLLPGAVLDRATVERVDNGQRRLVNTVLAGAQGMLDLRAGDHLRVHGAEARADDALILIGPAKWPGRYAVGPKTRLSDILRSPADLEPLTDLDFALILRRTDDGAGKVPVYLNLRRAFAGDADADLPLRAGDQLYVFGIETEQGTGEPSGFGITAAERQTALALGVGEDKLEPGAVSGAQGSAQGSSASQLPPRSAEDINSASQKLQSLREDPRRGLTAGRANTVERFTVDGTPEQSSAPQRVSLQRTETMSALAAELYGLARFGSPAPVARIVGAVRFSGEVPLDPERNTVQDILRAAGGLLDVADDGFVEIARQPGRGASAGDVVREILRVDSEALRVVRVQPGDSVAVRSRPGASDRRTVTVIGEVLYPGSYQVSNGTTLGELIQRTGGLTVEGFARGAVFTRAELRRKEQVQVERLRKRLRSDLAAASLTKAAESPRGLEGLQAIEGLFEQLAQYEPLGRLVIDLPRQLEGRGVPITLEDGDTLIIPKIPEEVTVVGEVQFPTSHRWEPDSQRDYYLERSGGYTDLANERRTFIVRADGSVDTRRGGWFRASPQALPGDVIVVPLDATPIEPITLAGNITQIFSQLALTIAALNSVGAF